MVVESNNVARPQLHLLKLSRYPIFAQLQLEEALLRADTRNWCLLNDGAASPAIVMGISGQLDLMVDQNRLQQFPVPVIRRFSGGGTVLVDESTLFITFICNSHETQVACCPEKVLAWTGKFYQTILSKQGFCLRENDYALGERKFGGNAQYFRKERWLHHSSLLWDFCPDRMEHLRQPVRAPEYRRQRKHNDFLCRLKDHYLDRESFVESLEETLYRVFDVHQATIEDVDDVLRQPHRKATTIVA